MGVSGFIAGRKKFSSPLAVMCIAVSYLVMIVAVAVSGGFRNEIRSGISRMSGDVALRPVGSGDYSGDAPVVRHPSYLDRLEAIPGVVSVEPVIYRAGIVKSGETIHGVMFKGVENTSDTTSLSVSIPRKLSSLLMVGEGDDLLAYFVGESVKLRKFKIASVYDGLLDSEDKLVVYARLDDLQRVNGWTEDEVSTLEIIADESMRTVRSLENLESEVGYVASAFREDDDPTLYASSSVSRYPQLFDWLNLIDFNVAFILALMTVVAGFNMISGLLITLFENISTIGLLKALGMKNRGIGRAFLLSSSVAVLKGMLCGNALAAVFCLVQRWTHLLKLDPQNYFVSYVPVHLSPVTVVAADALSFVVIMLLLLIPTMFISRVDPAETVKVN